MGLHAIGYNAAIGWEKEIVRVIEKVYLMAYYIQLGDKLQENLCKFLELYAIPF